MVFETVHWHDIWFTCTYEVDYSQVNMDFKVYPISAVNDDGAYEYRRKDADCGMDFSQNGLEDAQVFVHGNIKWDGCSNLWFDEQDTGTMLHFCGRSSIDDFRELMKRLYDLAAEVIHKWDKSVAE